MNDLKFAFRQLLKNPGFTVHPLQCRRPDRVQCAQCCFKKPRHLRQYRYGERAASVLTLAPHLTRKPSNAASREAFGSKLQNASQAKIRAEDT